MKRITLVSSLLAMASVALSGCATTSATPMSLNTVKIDVKASPSCAGKTNELMMQRAGIETIRRGYDKYILLDHGTGSVVTGVNQYGQVSRAGRGAVVVKMFKDGDPEGANALSARGLLGPDWQEMVNKKTKTSCL